MDTVTVYVDLNSSRVVKEERTVRVNHGGNPVFLGLDDNHVIPLVPQARNLKEGDALTVLYLSVQGERVPLGVFKGKKYYPCIIK